MQSLLAGFFYKPFGRAKDCVALEPQLLPYKKERLALIARMLEYFEEVPGIWFDLGKVTPVTQACWEAL